MKNWGCTICGQWSQFLHYVSESGERDWHKESKMKKKGRGIIKGTENTRKTEKHYKKFYWTTKNGHDDRIYCWKDGYVAGRVVMSLDEWLCRWLNSYVAGWMVMSLDAWLRRWINGYVAGWVVTSLDEWLRRCMSGYVAGWMVISQDEWLRR
jgi:hypothetical protein